MASGIPMASGPGRGGPEKLTAIPMSIPMASGVRMASGPGREFPEKLLAIPMGIPMASGPGRGFS